MDLNGIGAIVTGGASGLGGATAAMLVSRGAKVTIFDLNETAGLAQAKLIGAKFIPVNVTDEASVRDAIDLAEADHGVARVLVNCAGIATVGKTIDKDGVPHPLELFRRALECGEHGNSERNQSPSRLQYNKGLIDNVLPIR